MADSAKKLVKILELNHFLPEHADFKNAAKAVAEAFQLGEASICDKLERIMLEATDGR